MDQKILDKIKKCLALAGSDNPNEAATALRQAQALMSKHGITSEDMELSEITTSKVKSGAGKTPPQWIAQLAKLVCTAFGVDVVYEDNLVNWNEWRSKVVFIGVNSSPEIAGYAYEVLLRQLKKGRSDFLKTLNKRLKRTTKTMRGDLYAEGWISSVRQQVISAEVSEQDRDLTKRWISTNLGSLVAAKVTQRGAKARGCDHAAYYQGRADGKKVSFHQGVRADRQAALSSTGCGV